MKFYRPYTGTRPIWQEFGHTAFANAHPNWYAAYSCGHPGIDIGMPNGTPLKACIPGLIEIIYSKGSGNCVSLVNGGYRCWYEHLKSFNVSAGQIVKPGDIIGLSDNTGTATTGPHLHFQTDVNGKPTNPRNFIDFNKEPNYQEDIVLKDKRSFKFGTESVYGVFSDTQEWQAATGQSKPWQMINKKAIKFKDKPEIFVSISNMDSYRQLLGDLKPEELDVIPKSDLDGLEEQIKVLENKIKELEAKLAVDEEEIKKGILDRFIVWLKSIIGLK